MYYEILEACLKRNLAQANRTHIHLRSLGFTGSQPIAHSFVITAINAIYGREHTDKELESVVTDCDHDGGIDAFYFTNDSVDIFECKNVANLGLRDTQVFESRLNELVFAEVMPTPVSEDWKALRMSLSKIHSSTNKRKKIRIFFVRRSFARLSKSIREVIERIKKHDGVEVQFLNGKDLVDRMLEQEFLPEWRLNKRDCVSMCRVPPESEGTGHHRVLILKIPLENILDLYEQHLKQGKDLFAKNVRIPKKSPVFSEGLEETLSKHTDDFYLFHNGITVTASDILANATSYLLVEPQVVNGAQTIENIYLLSKSRLSKGVLHKASIICKIIKADEDMTSQICETSNTQKEVKVQDLRTNDVFQKQLELLINNSSNGSYEYSRKGQPSTRKGARKIRYTAFFQWAYSALGEKPAEAKNSKKLLFEVDSRGEYEKIQKEVLEKIQYIVLLCEIGVFVEDKIKSISSRTKKGRIQKGLMRDMNLHIVAGIYLLEMKKGKGRPSTMNYKLDKVFKILLAFYTKKHAQDNSLDSGRLFSKSDVPWKHLKTKLQ